MTAPASHVLEQLDLYLDRELAANTRAGVEAHLDGCPECASELRARTAVRDRLRAVVKGVALSPALEQRVRNVPLGRRRSPWPAAWTVLAIAAALLACVTLYTVRQISRVSPEAYIAGLSEHVGAIMRVGLGDHIHCAVIRKYPRLPPTAEEMARSLGPEYRDLLPLLKDHLPPNYRVVMAHRCTYNGRPFIHLVAAQGPQLMSLVITRKEDGETFSGERFPPLLLQSGIAVYQAGVERFRIAGFETSRHLVYLVSDSVGRTTVDVIAAVATGVRDVLSKTES